MELVVWPAAFCPVPGVGPMVAAAALLHVVAGGFHLLAGGVALAAAAALGHVFRLAGVVVLLRVLFPLFVGLSRVAVHRMGVPVIVAAPVVWTGLELARAHVLTGMTMASLGHTQYRWIEVIQISDLAGAFGVSFLVMFVAACLGRMLPCDGKPWAAGRWRRPWPSWPPRWFTVRSALAGRREGRRPTAGSP